MMDAASIPQLLELFPQIEEDFILGLYDAYKDENPEFDEIVEIVFSYPFPPLKQTINDENILHTNEHEDLQDHSDDVSVDVVTEMIDGRISKEDVLMVSSNNTVENNVQESFNGTISNCDKLKKKVCDNNRISETSTLLRPTRVSSIDQTQIADVSFTDTGLNGISNSCDSKFAETLEFDIKCVPVLPNLEGISHSIIEYPEAYLGPFKINIPVAEEENGNENTTEENQVKLLFSQLPFSDNESAAKEVLHLVNNFDMNCDEIAISDNGNVCSANEIELMSNNYQKLSKGKGLSSDFIFKFGNSEAELNSEVTSTGLINNDGRYFNERCQIIQTHICTKLDEPQPCTSNSVLISDQNKTTTLCKFSSTANKAHSAHKVSSSDDLEAVYEKQSEVNTECVSVVKTQQGEHLQDIETQFSSTESKLLLLSKIFPDADPSYLTFNSKRVANSDELLLFISQNINTKMYPKRRKLEESTPQVLGFDCTVEEFLQYIPDPIAEFQSPHYIRNGYEENAEIYLKSRYKTLPADFLKQRLLMNKYSLVKVCEVLDSEGYEACPHCWQDLVLHHSPSVFFHQEVWYIEHKTDIHNFFNNAIEAAKLEEELNKPPPPSVEEVFECGICADEIIEYSELGSCDGPSGHLFCKACIKRHIEVQMGEAKTSFSCLNKCGGFIHLQTVKEVLHPQTFDILMNKVGEEEVRKANIPGVETCPFCPYAYGPGEEDVVFVCLNSDCMKQSCRTCRKEDHSGVCSMFKDEDEEAARHFIENKMTEALVRNCNSCGKGIVKETGCNKMKCVCGALMCYICRQPVQDYTHFNGPGGDNTDRCELFSDDALLHDLPVAATAKQAFDQLIANHPQLQLDPNKIIPK